MSLESLKLWYGLELDIYSDVDNVMGHEPLIMFQKIKNNVGHEPHMWCRRTVDYEFALWSEDLTGLELGSCSWVLKKFNQKSMICWCGVDCQYNSVMWCKQKSSTIY